MIKFTIYTLFFTLSGFILFTTVSFFLGNHISHNIFSMFILSLTVMSISFSLFLLQYYEPKEPNTNIHTIY